MAIVDTAAELIVTYPQLADAVQPLPAGRYRHVPRLCGREDHRTVFDPVARVIEYARHGLWKLDARSPESLVGPLIARGYCLRELIKTGDRVWIDPERPARDGDLVALAVDERAMTSTIARLVHEPGFCEAHGSALANVWIKLLRHVRGQHMIFEAGGGAPLTARYRPLGVVRYVERGARAIYV